MRIKLNLRHCQRAEARPEQIIEYLEIGQRVVATSFDADEISVVENTYSRLTDYGFISDVYVEKDIYFDDDGNSNTSESVVYRMLIIRSEIDSVTVYYDGYHKQKEKREKRTINFPLKEISFEGATDRIYEYEKVEMFDYKHMQSLFS